MDENVSPSPKLTDWETLANATSTFVQELLLAKEEAEKRADALQLEVYAWKSALKAKDDEMLTMQRLSSDDLASATSRLAVVQRDYGSVKDDNPLLYCLIDGDGHIFSENHLVQGRQGGLEAARLLTDGLTAYMSDRAGLNMQGRPKVWVTVFLNKSGLTNVLSGNGVCTADTFNAFLQGFNNASPWFSVNDVGSGKEAADAKIHEHLRVLTRNPQIVQVFFAGGHDNGYTTTLNYLQTEGLLDKVTLLRGYEALGYELRILRLPEVKLDGVFMADKLQSLRPKPKPPSASISPADFESFRSLPQKSNPEAIPAGSKPLTIPIQPLVKLNPRPCTLHYLSRCRDGAKCTNGHHYQLNADQLLELRTHARNSPCKASTQGKCSKSGDCPWGHVCPNGSSCKLVNQGKCKFPADMHPNQPNQRNNGRGNHRKT